MDGKIMKKTIVIMLLMLVFSIMSITVCAHSMQEDNLNIHDFENDSFEKPHSNNPPLTPMDNYQNLGGHNNNPP